MKLIVGLGNPGPKYAKTRHNVGFMVVEELARSLGADFREKFNGEWAKGALASEDVVLLKPLTYMNESGRSVQPATAFFHVAPSATELLVVHDELDIPFGEVRLKVAGGHAGHNGLRSIIGVLGAEFARIRVGIGRPPAGFTGAVADYVLSPFDASESVELGGVIDKGVAAVREWVSSGPLAGNKVNTRPPRR